MESNWRWNVYASGWVHSPFTLVARLVTPLAGYNCIAMRPIGPFRFVSLGTSDMTGWVPSWTTPTTIFPKGFPYFYDVVPDQPAVDWV